MAIEIRKNTPKQKADVAQQVEQRPCKAKAEGSSSSVRANFSLIEDDGSGLDGLSRIVQQHKDRLAYAAAYQRDYRTIKRLGLDITVAAYRKMKESENGKV